MRHGTITGYQYHKCRCTECRAAKNEEVKAYYARRIKPLKDEARRIREAERAAAKKLSKAEKSAQARSKYEPGTLILKERYATLKAAVEDGWSYSEICRTYNTTQPTLIKHFGRSRFKSGHTPESSAIRKANAVIREMGDTL